MLPVDGRTKNAIQVFSPDEIMPVTAGEVAVHAYQAIAFSVDLDYSLTSGGPTMPLSAGSVLGVVPFGSIFISAACNMAFME